MTPGFQRAYFHGGYARLLARHRARRVWIGWRLAALGRRALTWWRGQRGQR